jgi:hypothetical protein
MRKNRGEEIFWALIHLLHISIYLEISQGNSLYHFFLFFLIIGEQEGRTGPACRGGGDVGISGRRGGRW